MVSIIMITYNRTEYLPPAIGSVLAQTFSDWELIIIDDCSADDTPELVKKFHGQDARVKYFRNENHLGISKSRNKGLALSSGKYVAVLDSDDEWLDTEKLSKQVSVMEADGGLALLGSAVVEINEAGEEIKKRGYPTSDKDIRGSMFSHNPFIHSSVIFKKEDAVKVGGYDENLRIGEDYDLWLKLGRAGKLANSGEFLIKYRVHDKGATLSDKVRGALDHLRIIKRYRRDYPNYFPALLKAYLRVIVAKIV